jgi:hypothetical protein
MLTRMRLKRLMRYYRRSNKSKHQLVYKNIRRQWMSTLQKHCIHQTQTQGIWLQWRTAITIKLTRLARTTTVSWMVLSQMRNKIIGRGWLLRERWQRRANRGLVSNSWRTRVLTWVRVRVWRWRVRSYLQRVRWRWRSRVSSIVAISTSLGISETIDIIIFIWRNTLHLYEWIHYDWRRSFTTQYFDGT